MGLEVKHDPQNIFFRCVESSSEAIMISDRSGRLVYVNPAWSRIYGYSLEEALGQTPRILHSGMQSNEFYQAMWRQIQDPQHGSWKGELVNRAKDESLVPVLLTITSVKSDSGETEGYMGIAVNITDKKELEAKVSHQDRLASIGLLASGLAHEVGTPLGVVRGRAELLMMQAESPAMKKSLEVITSQIDRISKLIRSLLRMSRSFNDVRLTPVRLCEPVGDVLALMGQNLRQDCVEIINTIPETIQAQVDSARLEQVILNLVMNATHAIRKAMDGGRRGCHKLILTAKEMAEGDLRWVELSVTDTGCGIAPENMKKLFKPFFTTKDVGEGTGLGLAIVAQLIRELESEISVQSKVDVGTTFTLKLKPAEAARNTSRDSFGKGMALS